MVNVFRIKISEYDDTAAAPADGIAKAHKDGSICNKMRDAE